MNFYDQDTDIKKALQIFICNAFKRVNTVLLFDYFGFNQDTDIVFNQYKIDAAL